MERADVEQWKGREVARLLALVETERRYYQDIIAALPVGLAVVSRDNLIQSANRSFRQMFGVRPEDVRRRTLDQVIAAPELQTHIAEMHATAAPSIKFNLMIGEGEFRTSLIPIRAWDNDTDLEAMLVIEEMPQAQAVAITGGAPALIWTANPETFEFTHAGGSEEGFSGHPGSSTEQIHPNDQDRIAEFYREAFKKPGIHACEYRAVAGDGAVHWYRDSFKVQAATGSKPAKVSGVVTEITSRRAAEQVAAGWNRLDALASLSRTVSHDLNNPLMIVTGYGEELLSSFEEQDARRGEMQQLLTAARRLSDLSTQLLEFTRRPAGHVEAVPLSGVLHEAPPDLVVMADPTLLTEVVRIVRSRLSTVGQVTTHAHKLTLTDQVPGAPLPGDYAEIIFHGQSQAPVSFEALVPGKEPMGAELARAHALLREWGGGVWQDEADVHVLLRAAVAAAPQVQAEGEPAVEEATAEPEPEPVKETILVVEDEGGIRALVRKILKRQDYEVIEAASPSEAIAAASTHKGKIDLLVTDMTLPERNGRELAEELSGLIPNLKVLFVSGYTDDTTVSEHDLPAGAAFLQKPFTLGSLLKKVREVLDQ